MAGWQSFTSTHFKLAFNAANRAKKDPMETVIVIFLSCAWIESILNEVIYQENIFFDDLNTLTDSEKEKIFPIHRKPSILIDLDLETTSIRDKIDKIYLLLNKNRCPWGIETFQSFYCLLQIRNSLVHTKPQSQKNGKVKHHKFLQYLISKNFILNPGNEPHNWIHLICNKEVANWALETVKKVISYLAKKGSVENFSLKCYLEYELRKVSRFDVSQT